MGNITLNWIAVPGKQTSSGDGLDLRAKQKKNCENVTDEKLFVPDKPLRG